MVVDITPAELIQRLKDGKVYLPENAKRAARRFLQPGNLTALRELALRRTADRVDDQMVDYLRQNAIEGPWATAERLLVCVGADALRGSSCAPRAGWRRAQRPWIACMSERAATKRSRRGCAHRRERCVSPNASAPTPGG